MGKITKLQLLTKIENWPCRKSEIFFDEFEINIITRPFKENISIEQWKHLFSFNLLMKKHWKNKFQENHRHKLILMVSKWHWFDHYWNIEFLKDLNFKCRLTIDPKFDYNEMDLEFLIENVFYPMDHWNESLFHIDSIRWKEKEEKEKRHSMKTFFASKETFLFHFISFVFFCKR